MKHTMQTSFTYWLMRVGSFYIITMFCSMPFCQASESAAQYSYSPDQRLSIRLEAFRTTVSDNMKFKEKTFDDSRWELYTGWRNWGQDRHHYTGVSWYRATFALTSRPDQSVPLAILQDEVFCAQDKVVGACETYWDGILIAHNGVVGRDIASETPGKIGAFVIIPSNLCTPGPHCLAIRISNFHSLTGVGGVTFFQFGEAPYLFGSSARRSAVVFFLIGALMLTAIFHLAIRFGRISKWPHGLFAALCLCWAVYLFLSILQIFQINSEHFYNIQTGIYIVRLIMMVVLPAFFLYQFSFPHRRTCIIILVIIGLIAAGTVRPMLVGFLPLGIPQYYIPFFFLPYVVSNVLSVIAAIWAVHKKKIGGLNAIIGSFLISAGSIISMFSIQFPFSGDVGLIVFIGLITVSLSRQMAQRNRTYEQTELKAVRLELELLKKHIHPHFLLNSLNSIVAWIEEEPATAVKLVSALADELRMLLRVAPLPIIPINEEISLCKVHLEVMGLRHGKTFSLITEQLSGKETIPPLVIHTLVENGLTHGYAGRSSGVFTLTRVDIPNGYRLLLLNDGTSKECPIKRGTGLLYVEKRLEEAYPGKWKFTSGKTAGGWTSTIDIVYG